ncbi:nuclear receptor subfamily 0 group B member 2-like [Parambassis ranga]|uniref:Nuclear receptor subfamily 0 group B member 2-like n=1 Tax=Parambassis ranga TaxID=210632 RepID=A0A6P7HVX8_9TELE|nr:nuclear receptor subfamily 0 group B member 2-like [Parambassis ranga]
MHSLEEKITSRACPGDHVRHAHAVLYNILSWRDGSTRTPQFNTTAHNCPCEQRRTVCRKDPRDTSSVLLKTIRFMRSLPSFSQLPLADQLSLLGHCWVPLFVLGLAQEKIEFEVAPVPQSSILRQILLGPGFTESDHPTLAGVHRLTTCLHELRNLNLSTKEYAYLKGAMLFNPAIPGLSARVFIEGLQQEAQRALRDIVHLLYPEDSHRFSRILLTALSVQTINHGLVTEFFFKPVISNRNMLDLITEMLFCPMESQKNVLHINI